MVHDCVGLVNLRVDIEQEAVLHSSTVCGLSSLMCVHGVLLSPALISMALISPVMYLATLPFSLVSQV